MYFFLHLGSIELKLIPRKVQKICFYPRRVLVNFYVRKSLLLLVKFSINKFKMFIDTVLVLLY